MVMVMMMMMDTAALNDYNSVTRTQRRVVVVEYSAAVSEADAAKARQQLAMCVCGRDVPKEEGEE